MPETKTHKVALIPGDGIGADVNHVAGYILSSETRFKGELP